MRFAFWLQLVVSALLAIFGIYWLIALVAPLPGADALRNLVHSSHQAEYHAGSKTTWNGWGLPACLFLGFFGLKVAWQSMRQSGYSTE